MPDLFYVVDTFLPNGLSQRIIMIDTVMLSGLYATRPKDQPEEGTPDDREYSDKMFQWIEDRIIESDDFDFLFIAGLGSRFYEIPGKVHYRRPSETGKTFCGTLIRSLSSRRCKRTVRSSTGEPIATNYEKIQCERLLSRSSSHY